jgi:hypothetical protein
MTWSSTPTTSEKQFTVKFLSRLRKRTYKFGKATFGELSMLYSPFSAANLLYLVMSF